MAWSILSLSPREKNMDGTGIEPRLLTYKVTALTVTPKPFQAGVWTGDISLS